MNITIVRPSGIITDSHPESARSCATRSRRDFDARTAGLSGVDLSRREVRAVILEAGGKVFCSCHDLSDDTGRDVT